MKGTCGGGKANGYEWKNFLNLDRDGADVKKRVDFKKIILERENPSMFRRMATIISL